MSNYKVVGLDLGTSETRVIYSNYTEGPYPQLYNLNGLAFDRSMQ